MPRETRFVETAAQLLHKLHCLLPRVARDRIANEEFVDTAEMLSTLAGDLVRPVQPYVDVMIPRSAMVEHAFEEVDS